MNAAASRIEYEITENHLLRLTNAQGHRVECVSGRALITACGELLDIELCAGQVFVVPNRGLVLIEAIKHGRIRIVPAAARHPAWAGLLPGGWRSVAGPA